MERYHEIVRVLSGDRLIDRESFECKYRTASGRKLAPGFYVVTWPEGIESPKYDENARFIGPHKLLLHARIVLRREMQLRSPDLPTAPARHEQQSEHR